MTSEEQLKLWVAGVSVHNDDVWYNVVDDAGNVVDQKKLEGGECCPDFSCCEPELLQPVEVRRAFVAAGEREREKFLMAFLGAAVAKATPEALKVHIAGGEEPS
jgi:hypothetical protein